jgi:mono/diheme cytochrome c family protein
MNPNRKRMAACGLALSLFAPFVFELTVTQATAPQRHTSTARRRGGEPVGDVFRNNCARCHGADGRGDTPLGNTYKAPDFTDPEWWQRHSNITSGASLISIVSRGKGGMPAFGKKLSRTEIRRLVGYVRRFKNQKPSN